MSERWQQEVAETVFEAINQDTDKVEQKKKSKPKIDEVEENCKYTFVQKIPICWNDLTNILTSIMIFTSLNGELSVS